MLDVEIPAEMISKLRSQTKEALRRLNPSFSFYESGTEIKNVPLGWFEFKSYGLDSDVYNLMFIARVERKMVHGIFNCDYKDALEWRDAARQMMYSIKDITQEEVGK